jgi:hypothetical protein
MLPEMRVQDEGVLDDEGRIVENETVRQHSAKYDEGEKEQKGGAQPAMPLQKFIPCVEQVRPRP